MIILCQVLLAMRAHVEDRGMKGDCTPLMEAASAGHTGNKDLEAFSLVLCYYLKATSLKW